MSFVLKARSFGGRWLELTNGYIAVMQAWYGDAPAEAEALQCSKCSNHLFLVAQVCVILLGRCCAVARLWG
jgi:hypothetical protein